MGTVELSPWACVPVASQEEAGRWRGQSLQVCGLRKDQGAVRTAVSVQAQRDQAVPAGPQESGAQLCHRPGGVADMARRGAPRGAAECVGRLWARVASRTPSLPLPLPLHVPVLAVPRFPWPREGGSMAARPLEIFASGDPGPASWGQEVMSCPAVQALSPSARQAQGGFAGGHTPLRPLGGSPQG